MAILKMKKLRLIAVRSNKEELLRELIRHGCVEISELEGELHGTDIEALVHRESSDVASLKSRHTTLTHAIDLLDHYAPKKGKLLSAKPELDDRVLLDDTGLAGALKVAEGIESYDARIKRISAEESRQRGVIQSLQPWLDLDLPLGTEGTERCAVLLGTIPARTELGQVEAALEQIDAESELFCVHEEKKEHYVVFVCMREKLAEMQECLRGFGFSAASFTGVNGTAKESTIEARNTLRSLEREKVDCLQYIVDEAVRRDELKLAADRVSVQISLAEAGDKLYGTDSAVIMEGWYPEEREAELNEVFERFGCAWEALVPEEDEYPNVPVKLKNNKITNALNMVTNMYSLPAYGTVDPNPLMAPFFILFYGIMMADMGYGLLMILASIIITKKSRPKGTSGQMFGLMFSCGISTFIMGALTGGFFGDFLPQLVGIINPDTTFKSLPALFTPLDDTITILIGAMALGFVQIVTGMAISFVEKIKKGEIMDAIWEELTWWVVFAGIACMALGVTNIVLYVGLGMVVVGSGWSAKGFGKVTAIFGSVYNHVTGYFGDILSYSRLMTLMLAGSVIASVFNTLGAIPGNVVFFLLVSVAGNGLNFALNLLSCYVHDLRLQCLEYFGKFYKDGGKPFAPLAINTNYVDIQS